MELLEKRFARKVNFVSERYTFRQRAQGQGESINSFISNLRELAKSCDFGQKHDEMIRDQLIEKTNSRKIRERLLVEENLTLDKAITLAQRVEAALKDSSTFAGTTEGRRCYRCNSSRHLANDPTCPANGEQCRNCKKIGHFARVCRFTKGNQQGVKVHYSGKKHNQVREVNLFPKESFSDTLHRTEAEKEAEIQVLTLEENFAPAVQSTTLASRPMSCDVLINQVPISMQVDTGSGVTILGKDLFDKHFLREALVPPPRDRTFSSYTQHEIDIIGCFRALVKYQGATLTQMKNGKEVTVEFTSRTLSESERKYSIVEKEALACVWACERWNTYLWGRKFTLRTDHKALVTLFSKRSERQSLRLARWSCRLLKYNFEVEYQPGEVNILADALSRVPVTASAAEYDKEDEVICNVALSAQIRLITLDHLKQEVLKDKVMQILILYITEGWPRL
ncbi:hypothetical protein HOLleu_22650 [Holothuria leucospilota]|uniref:CCHC-type domain-containing protein n=1 Tax=Holothuria leucospilota TaxID=206669 RepID=A0A9Q1BYR8_HOLLE|nr:hypothetical protein HOLleu_22650 [Holothuria leucospilota]